MADVDNDAFWAAKLVFVIRRAEIHRPGFFRTGGFQRLKLFLVVVGGKANVIDAGMTAHAGGERQYRDIDRAIAQIDGVILALLDHLHAHRVDEKLRHGVHIHGPISDMPYLSHWLSPSWYQILHC